MTRHVLRLVLARVAAAVPVAFGLLLCSFLLIRFVPGGPFDRVRALTPEVRHNLEHRYRLDRPLGAQFAAYVSALAHGDLGESLSQPGREVRDVLADGAALTLTVGGLALALAVAFGVPLGLVAAARDPGQGPGVAAVVMALLQALPTFVVAPCLVLVFGLGLRWLPVGGYSGRPLELVLPAVTLSLVPLAELARFTEVRARAVQAKPFVRAARLRGLGDWVVLCHYVLPPTLLPVIAYAGPLAAGVLAGSLVTERVFGLPGTGAYLVDGALARDYPLVLGASLAYLGLVLVLTLAADLAALALDPAARRGVDPREAG